MPTLRLAVRQTPQRSNRRSAVRPAPLCPAGVPTPQGGKASRPPSLGLVGMAVASLGASVFALGATAAGLGTALLGGMLGTAMVAWGVWAAAEWLRHRIDPGAQDPMPCTRNALAVLQSLSPRLSAWLGSLDSRVLTS